MGEGSKLTEEQLVCRYNISEVLQILGAKWAFLVIAELHDGPLRFRELQRALEVVKTQSLTDTLRHLEQNGIVRREVFPTVPVSVEYSLTERGHDFNRVLGEMNGWVTRWRDADTGEAAAAPAEAARA